MRRIFLLFFLLVTACSQPASQTATALPVSTLAPTMPPAEVPTSTVTPIPIPAREKYTLNTFIDYDLHFIDVAETIVYPNHTGQQLTSLTLAVAPNFWPNCFYVMEIKVDGAAVTNYTLNLNRLDIPLPTPLEPDSVSTVSLRYSIFLPYMDQVNSQRARIFGYSEIQMNLVNWYPFIAPFKDGDWVIREPWSHGEYLVYPIADFEVNVKFADPQTAPVIATSGFAEPNGEFTRYTLTAGRAFAISASRDFQVSTTQVGETTVYSYYFPIYKNAGDAAMLTSAQAIQVFSQMFGLYPHKTLSIVIADFQDSMEFSALYFHSRSFYNLYDGSPQSYLIAVAAHETGHQWWFDQVANDQAQEPWLDESLTTYSEAIYYEAAHPDALAWWWTNRIDFFEPFGEIDIPVYEGQNADTYKYIVYFNGAHFMKDLRGRIGDEAFFAFLQDYYNQGRERIVSGDDFFRILDTHTDVDYSDIVSEYFKNR
jgi:hypothetical protein